MSRRDEVIEAATSIVRESGPEALTSVSVSRRLGVTQPAVYRHVRDMDELRTLANQAVVDELLQVVGAAAAAPAPEWSDGTYIARFALRLTQLFIEHQRGFEIMDRWRHDPSVFGAGIRAALDGAAEMIGAVVEGQWRRDLGHERPFDHEAAQAQSVHARLMVDDVVSVARVANSSTPPMSVDEASRLLSLRIFAGWTAYALHMARLCGLPAPELDGACLKIPTLRPV